MRRLTLRAEVTLLMLFLCIAPAGCGDEDDGPTTPIKVATYNLYLGSELTRLVTTTAAGIPEAAAAIHANVVASDFPERAKVLAALITAAAPDLVGLQEVSLFRTQTPSDFAPGPANPNATEPMLDFLELLMAEIALRGGGYRVVNEAVNADAELPVAVAGGQMFDLRLTDRDVILARDGVEASAPEVSPFASTLMLPIGGSDGGVLTNFARSWSRVTAKVAGATITFANAHLEVGAAEPIQIEQAKETLAGLRALDGPIILVGDFNSPPEPTRVNSYLLLTDEFRDAYPEARGQDDGFTCCQEGDLKNATSTAHDRIDLVLYRGKFRVVAAEVIGADAAGGRTPGGLWASDHLGVTATLNLRP